jgi:hypothetical protein
MKRLVYSPSIKAWVKTDTGVIDLSPYITKCNITRNINELSTAEIFFRNPKVMKNGKPKFLFTECVYPDGSIHPMLHPMDPITIVFERIAGRPIQVFTGYCDTTPYIQLFPGVARLTASCTLKRLNYTYWDPALNFVREFLKSYGWIISPETGKAVNEAQATKDEAPSNKDPKSVQLHDSNLGSVLYGVLNEVGGWDDNNIYIQPLPSNISTIVANLFAEFSKDNKKVNEEIADFIKQIIGEGPLGSAVTGSLDVNYDVAGNPGQTVGGGQGYTGPVDSQHGDPNGSAKTVGYPFASVSGTKFNGGPGVPGSTHAWAYQGGNSRFDNWQSCNAVDIDAPVGTKVTALDDGIITRCGGSWNGGAGRTDGLTWHLKTADNDWFYQHNSARYVSDGQRVKRGDVLGKSGSGNNVPHLHLACIKGNPVKLITPKIPGS